MSSLAPSIISRYFSSFQITLTGMTSATSEGHPIPTFFRRQCSLGQNFASIAFDSNDFLMHRLRRAREFGKAAVFRQADVFQQAATLLSIFAIFTVQCAESTFRVFNLFKLIACRKGNAEHRHCERQIHLGGPAKLLTRGAAFVFQSH